MALNASNFSNAYLSEKYASRNTLCISSFNLNSTHTQAKSKYLSFTPAYSQSNLHESDPLASLNITTNGIRKMVRGILNSKKVPFVFFLEGGYDVEALGRNVKVTLEEMLT